MTDPTPAPDGLRQQYADALRRWGLLDEVNDPEATAAFVTTDLMAVRDRELEGLRDERDLHLAAFWQAVKQRDRALAQSAIDRPAADWAEAALARVRALAERWEHALAPDRSYAHDLRTALDSTAQPTGAAPVLDVDQDAAAHLDGDVDDALEADRA